MWNNPKIPPVAKRSEKLRIQLRNAIIRPTLAYALQTQELTQPASKNLIIQRDHARVKS